MKDKIVDLTLLLVILFIFSGCAGQQDDWTKLQAKRLPELQKWCFTWNKDWFNDPSAPYCKVGDIWYYENMNGKARGIVLEKIGEEQ